MTRPKMMSETSAFDIAQAAIKQASATSKLRSRLRPGNEKVDEPGAVTWGKVGIAVAVLIALELIFCWPQINEWRLKHACPTYCTSSEIKSIQFLNDMERFQRSLKEFEVRASDLLSETETIQRNLKSLPLPMNPVKREAKKAATIRQQRPDAVKPSLN